MNKREFAFPGVPVADNADGTQTVKARVAMQQGQAAWSYAEFQPTQVVATASVTVPLGGKLRVDWRSVIAVNFANPSPGYSQMVWTLSVTGAPDDVTEWTVAVVGGDSTEEVESLASGFGLYEGLSGAVAIQLAVSAAGGSEATPTGFGGTARLLTTIAGGA